MQDLEDHNYVQPGWYRTAQFRTRDQAHRWSTAYHILNDKITLTKLKSLSDGRDLDGNIWFKEEWEDICRSLLAYPPTETTLNACLSEATKWNASNNIASDYPNRSLVVCGALTGLCWASLSYAREGYEPGDVYRLPNILDGTALPTSKHVYGLAVDVACRITNGLKDERDPRFDALAAKHGVYRPFTRDRYQCGEIPQEESWHFEGLER